MVVRIWFCPALNFWREFLLGSEAVFCRSGTTRRSMPTATSPAVRRRGAETHSTSPKRAHIAPFWTARERCSITAGGNSVRLPVMTTRRRPRTFSAPAIAAAAASSACASHGWMPCREMYSHSPGQEFSAAGSAAEKLSSKSAQRNERFHAAHRAAAALAAVARHGRVADFTADGQRIGQRFAFDDDGAADAFAEIHEQKIFAVGVGQMMPQRQRAFFLHQQHRHVPDLPRRWRRDRFFRSSGCSVKTKSGSRLRPPRRERSTARPEISALSKRLGRRAQFFLPGLGRVRTRAFNLK